MTDRRTNKTWTNDDLIAAVKISTTYAEVARNLGLKTYGANSKTIKKYIKILNLDTSHFLTKKEQNKIARSFTKSLSMEEIFSINRIDRKYIKNIIIKNNLIDYKCFRCGITEWENETLSLHLDHINGINNDNRLENLRFLCPNCHSLTDSYCGKSLRNLFVKPPESYRCIDCDIQIQRKSARCRKCASFKRNTTKINWPKTVDLISMVNNIGYSASGRKLGISANAIKTRIRNHPND